MAAFMNRQLFRAAAGFDEMGSEKGQLVRHTIMDQVRFCGKWRSLLSVANECAALVS